jgi:beta-lactamase regulating signal transducer with metallopeptidase domain
MNLVDFIDASFPLRFTTTLFHFLWQGCIVGLFAFFGEMLLSRAAAKWRYALHVAAMLIMAACVPVTYLLVESKVLDSIASASPPAASIVGPEMELAPMMPESAFSPSPVVAPPKPTTESEYGTGVSLAIRNAAPYVTVVYFACLAVLMVRLVHGVWGGHRLRRKASVVTDASLLAALERQAQRLGLRAMPVLAWCADVSIPVVIGVLRPMILLPTAAATGLSPDQLHALLTHELAHIRRCDLLVNLLQRIVEAMLFFHPVVWYVSRRISNERELACDDLALTSGCERMVYADSLLRMAEMSVALRRIGRTAPATSLAASGENGSEFKRRILKVLGVQESSTLRPGRLALVLALSAALLAVVMPVAWIQFSRTANAQTPQPNAANPGVFPNAEARGTSAAAKQKIEELKPVFGKPVDGLELGIAFDSKSPKFTPGVWASFNVFIRNVSDQAIEFEYFSPFATGRVAVVRNAMGDIVPIAGHVVLFEVRPVRVLLQPGESHWDVEGFQVGTQADGKKSGPLWEDPKPGQYTAELPLPLSILSGGKPDEPTSVELSSAAIRFTVSTNATVDQGAKTSRDAGQEEAANAAEDLASKRLAAAKAQLARTEQLHALNLVSASQVQAERQEVERASQEVNAIKASRRSTRGNAELQDEAQHRGEEEHQNRERNSSTAAAPTGTTSEPDPAAKSLAESPLRRGERRAQPVPAVGGKARGAFRRPYDFRESSNYKALDAGARQSLETVHRDFALLWGALDMYIREHNNRAPENLEALVPRYLKELPKDPFATDETAAQKVRGNYMIRSLDGRGYWYRQGSGDAFIISSVGLPDFPYLAETNVGLYLARGNWVSGLQERQVNTSRQKPDPTVPDSDLIWKQLGVRLEHVKRDDFPLTGTQYRGAMKIVAVRAEGPAARQGMREGDFLVGLHIWETVNDKDVRFIVANDAIRQSRAVKFYILRGGETFFGYLELQPC